MRFGREPVPLRINGPIASYRPQSWHRVQSP